MNGDGHEEGRLGDVLLAALVAGDGNCFGQAALGVSYEAGQEAEDNRGLAPESAGALHRC